jgi:hypothetical protein
MACSFDKASVSDVSFEVAALYPELGLAFELPPSLLPIQIPTSLKAGPSFESWEDGEARCEGIGLSIFPELTFRRDLIPGGHLRAGLSIGYRVIFFDDTSWRGPLGSARIEWRF